MISPEIVKINVFLQTKTELLDALKGMEIEPFVLDVSPEAFSEDVVERAPAPVHAYGHAVRLEYSSKDV